MSPRTSRWTIGVFVILVQIVVFYGHWVLYWVLMFTFLPGPQALFWLKAALICLSLSFLTFHILAARWQNRLLGWADKAASIWLGTIHILMLASVIFWGIAYVFAENRILPPWTPLGCALLTMALIASVYGLVRSFRPSFTRYYVRLPNLPESWRGRKAVLVADTHLGNVFGRRDSERLVRMVNSENPDVVFLPGDYFDGPPADYESLAAPLAGIRAPHGVYFTEGNHEEFRDPAQYLEALRNANVKIWNNKRTVLDGMQILGLPYSNSNNPDELRTALAGLRFDRKQPSILLKHSPSAASIVAEAGISLMLCGHTHYGQMWPYSLLVRHIFGKAAYGHSEIGGMQLVTTSGFGTWGPPQRLRTRAELVVIKFI